jgi:hypothetical protein
MVYVKWKQHWANHHNGNDETSDMEMIFDEMITSKKYRVFSIYNHSYKNYDLREDIYDISGVIIQPDSAPEDKLRKEVDACNWEISRLEDKINAVKEWRDKLEKCKGVKNATEASSKV